MALPRPFWVASQRKFHIHPRDSLTCALKPSCFNTHFHRMHGIPHLPYSSQGHREWPSQQDTPTACAVTRGSCRHALLLAVLWASFGAVGLLFVSIFFFCFFFFLTTRNSLSNDQSLEEKLHLDTQRHSGQRPLVITVAKSKSIPASSRNILILNEFLGTERARRRLLLFVCFPEQMGLCAFCLNINQKSIYGDVSGTG